jgi:imidazolonepropionase-like amidohydrolase
MRTAMLFCTAILAAAGAFAEVTVLENFTLIDGTGRPPVPQAAMVITDGRISWIGPKSRLKPPPGAARTDLSGKYVMPGIINLHGHLGNTVGLKQDPHNYSRESVEKNLKTYASYGVTSVLSMGTDQDLIYPLRAEQRAGRPSFTRVFTAGRGFTGKGGYPTKVPGMKGIPYEVGTPEEVRRDVDELAAKKVDVVKIWVDDHLGREPKIPPAITKAIIDNAHQHNLKVAAHIFYLEDAKRLVNDGLNALAHSVRDQPVDDALIAAMKRKGAWQIPTLAREMSIFAIADAPSWLQDPFFSRSVDPTVVATLKSADYRQRIRSDPDFAKYPAFLKTAQTNLKRLADAGVKIGFGTDTGPPARFPGFFEHMEMQLMVESGLPAARVIQAATRDSAEFLGVSKDLGTLESGKWADLIVLAKDPLADIQNTRSLETVMIAGKKAN